jgi:uncharacterized SAM-binding protein YcdF (DUF218 family)
VRHLHRRTALILATTALGVAAVAAIVLRDATARWLVDPVAPAAMHFDAVVVLNGDNCWERTTEAIRLHRAGVVDVLVVSGAGHGGDSALAMAARMRAAGVPETAIRIEPRARTTRANMLLSAPILEQLGARRVGILSHGQHLRRAVGVARRVLPPDREVHGLVAPSTCMPIIHWWVAAGSRGFVLKEYEKLAYYWLRGWI